MQLDLCTIETARACGPVPGRPPLVIAHLVPQTAHIGNLDTSPRGGHRASEANAEFVNSRQQPRLVVMTLTLYHNTVRRNVSVKIHCVRPLRCI